MRAPIYRGGANSFKSESKLIMIDFLNSNQNLNPFNHLNPNLAKIQMKHQI